jgi:hypothetical protein
MTSDIPKYAEAVRRYEAIVPLDATVAIYGDYMFEYVFFGARMTRRLVPLGDGRQPMRAIPDGTQFLVFSSKTLPPTEATCCSDRIGSCAGCFPVRDGFGRRRGHVSGSPNSS